MIKHTTFILGSLDPREDSSKMEFLAMLERLGITYEIVDGREKYHCFYVNFKWDEYKMQKKLTRNAGAKRKHVPWNQNKVEDIRKRMETESAEVVAKSLGISRATLFRKLKEAEELNEDRIF